MTNIGKLAKGSLYSSSGTQNIPVPVGTNGTVLSADSTQLSGFSWRAYPIGASVELIAAPITNATGNGTVAPVIFGSELFDYGNGYNTATGIYTAPVNGAYQITAAVTFSSLTASFSSGYLVATIAGANYTNTFNPGAARDSANLFTATISVTANLIAGQTARISASVSGGAQTVGIQNNFFQSYTRASFIKLA